MNWSSSYTQIGGPTPATDRSCWNVAKIVLRCFSIVVCGAVIVVEVSTLLEFQKTFHSIPDITYFASPPALLAITCDFFEFIALCVRRGRGIHPVAHVALELILWLACFGMGGLVLRAAYNVNALVVSIKAYYSATEDYDGPDYGYYSEGDVQSLTNYTNKARAAGGLLFLIAVLRFVLFVRACVETDRRRRSKAAPTIVTTLYESHIPLAGVGPAQAYDPTAFSRQPPPYQPKPAPVVQAAPFHPQQHQYPAQPRYPS